MSSNSYSEAGKNSIDNVFEGIPTAQGEYILFRQFLDSHDFSPHTIRAMVLDIRKFAKYFTSRAPLIVSSSNNDDFK